LAGSESASRKCLKTVFSLSLSVSLICFFLMMKYSILIVVWALLSSCFSNAAYEGT